VRRRQLNVVFSRISFVHLAPVGLYVVVAEHHIVDSEEGVQLTRLLTVEHILVDLTQRKKERKKYKEIKHK
jgi:hypothetical protein